MGLATSPIPAALLSPEVRVLGEHLAGHATAGVALMVLCTAGSKAVARSPQTHEGQRGNPSFPPGGIPVSASVS